ncbi:hypothetical protein RSOL_064800, partial [Rhizoctonia solani AG-3 Rhs1AP]
MQQPSGTQTSIITKAMASYPPPTTPQVPANTWRDSTRARSSAKLTAQPQSSGGSSSAHGLAQPSHRSMSTMQVGNEGLVQEAVAGPSSTAMQKHAPENSLEVEAGRFKLRKQGKAPAELVRTREDVMEEKDLMSQTGMVAPRSPTPGNRILPSYSHRDVIAFDPALPQQAKGHRKWKF